MFRYFAENTSKKSQAEAIKPKYTGPYVPQLIELDSRYNLIKPKMRILEIGCYPGGWTKYLVNKTRSTSSNPTVFCVDPISMSPIPGSIFVHGDITEQRYFKDIEKAINFQKVDMVFYQN